MSKPLNVVALVLENHQGEILVAKRAQHKHLGGLWEFPGGKVEEGESQFQALKREISEELDYQLLDAKPLIITTHSYDAFTLTLDMWHHKDYNPQVYSNENQALKWVHKSKLSQLGMPEADQPIIKAILKHT